MLYDSIRAIILGIIEGVTEFLPVSSTGHLLLAERFFNLGEGNFWNSFTVLIQLGAILAILAIYFVKLWRIALGMFSNPDDRRFVIGVLVAFLPAAVIGAGENCLVTVPDSASISRTIPSPPAAATSLPAGCSATA